MNAKSFFMVFIISCLSVGIISSLHFASAVNAFSNDNWCSTGKVNSLGYCINGVTSSQGGIITSPSYSSQSNPISNTRGCSTGEVNSLGYCINGVNLQGNTNTSPSYSVPTTADSNAYWCSTGMITSQHLCSTSLNLQGGTIPNSTQSMSNSNTYWCKQGTSESNFCKEGSDMTSQAGVLSSNSSKPSAYCSTGVLNSQGLCSQPMVNSSGGTLSSMNSTIPAASSMSTSVYSGSQGVTTTVAHVSIPLGASNSNSPCVTANNCFNPTSLMVEQGAVVSWTNNDNVFHTVTSSSPSDVPSGTLFDRSISPGNVISMTFNNPGVVNYFCKIHPWLTGTILVGSSIGNASSQDQQSSDSMTSQAGILASSLNTTANFWTNAYGWSHPFSMNNASSSSPHTNSSMPLN